MVSSKEISIQQLKEQIENNEAILLVDVREKEEYEHEHIPHVTHHIPLHDLKNHVNQFAKDQVIIFSCRSGGRSLQAVAEFERAGFANVKSLAGGILAWKQAGFDYYSAKK